MNILILQSELSNRIFKKQRIPWLKELKTSNAYTINITLCRLPFTKFNYVHIVGIHT